ncbi:anaerobic sulfite reductase subunit AsrA [Clostridium cylindrosporum]|uniref:Anaerobic sulfite reductase subunit A n=1 Tax=Clostridium cylindrosporum DSM 605 TaxID=1121307 RepID=A0A0J8DAZ4_CLOCY|nr:anaerobic sulfite reductase subunit AsrA [Clostridium cylindrosporum]KMT23235.1 anaerobic sulfite reductase subunit A [Clostridium cylindrosporum DSM 605]
MGYFINIEKVKYILAKLSEKYEVYAPKLHKGEGCFSDTDVIRYGKITDIGEIVYDKKSDYSYKEVLLPMSQTLFYFTEDEVKVPKEEKGRIIFLRSCDLHSIKRLDEIYLRNGFEDYYYKRIRNNTKFILMGCSKTFENCFCVDMETNKSENYDAYIKVEEGQVYIDCKWEELEEFLKLYALGEGEQEVEYVSSNDIKVNIPNNLSINVMNSEMWKEYSARCIACGRCNFVCPTCTCFTTQDIFYRDNENTGERRRVWASCHVDGYTDMAGGHSFRQDKGQRMRFKVLHKVYDYKKRFGYHMCVGCGRCDDVCPEYISFSNCINKLEDGMKEVE